jgi:allophanate hydrolase
MTPVQAVEHAYDLIEAGPLHPVWISLVPRSVALEQANGLEQNPASQKLPLYGRVFAVKDNMDVAGMPTTAGCPGYAYTPNRSATVVTKLQEAGAILVGKTNMDQFATGLVGTRSPYGACASVYDPMYISGGSSSGSAVAVAKGLVDFALGTDTAGSGRVPASFNNLIGVKPTRGLISAAGIVPACQSLDCVSIFARTADDGRAVWLAARGLDALDPYSRAPQPGEGAAPWLGGPFRFGIPSNAQLEFFGDSEAASLFDAAIRRAELMGGTKVEIDFSPFRAVAELLYSGPWVAERYAAIQDFIESNADEMDPVVRGIISGAKRYSATNVFNAEYKLRALRCIAEQEWRKMDVLLLPTAGTTYRHEAIAADPIQLNTNLGYYTNFVNLLDLAAVAIPAGFRPNGLPFGVSLIGPAFTDEALFELAAVFTAESSEHPESLPPGCVEVAVVGAHLSGQPLNWQLTDRGARLRRTTTTAPEYRFFALDGTKPAKPGLIRESGFAGPGIEVEIWAMPENCFGSFVNLIPSPLGIGTVRMRSGESVKCFLCEPAVLANATEITHLGGWREYLKSLK